MIRKRIFEHKNFWILVFSLLFLSCFFFAGFPRTANADSDIISNDYLTCNLSESTESGGFRTDYISTTDTAILYNEYLPWGVVFYLNNADMSVQTNVSIDIKQFSENILTVELDDLVSSKYSFDNTSNTVTHSDGYWKIQIKNNYPYFKFEVSVNLSYIGLKDYEVSVNFCPEICGNNLLEIEHYTTAFPTVLASYSYYKSDKDGNLTWVSEIIEIPSDKVQDMATVASLLSYDVTSVPDMPVLGWIYKGGEDSGIYYYEASYSNLVSRFYYLENLGDTTFAIEKEFTRNVEYTLQGDIPYVPVELVEVDDVLISDFIGWEYVGTENNENIFRARYTSLAFRAYDSKGNAFDYDVGLSNFDEYYTKMYYGSTTHTKTAVWEYFEETLPYDVADYGVTSRDLYGYFFFSSIPKNYGISELIAQFTNTTWDGLIMMDSYSASYYTGTAWNILLGRGTQWARYRDWYERQTGINLEQYWSWFQKSWGNKAEVYHYYFYGDCTTSEIYIGRNGAKDYNDDTSRFDKVVQSVKDKLNDLANKGKDILEILFYVVMAILGLIVLMYVLRFIVWIFSGFKKSVEKSRKSK